MQPIRVLIADDQELVRDALADLIGSEKGLELVGAAVDADSAMALAASALPDVALLDVKMPGGGVSAARGIRACSPSTQIVALSAYEDRGSVLEMVRAGAIGYLVKGTSGDEIIQTIHRSARGESRLSSQATNDVVHELATRLERQEDDEERRRAAVIRIRKAIDESRIAFALQPILELDTRRCVGFEALARFQVEPHRPPNVWFREAEELGLQSELELAAVQLALPLLSQLPSDCYLSINVSPGVLTLPSLLDSLAASEPERIVVELTEHAAVENYDALNQALLELRACGARIAVDDAGAGFASLRHILRLSPDLIKLDASLTRELESSRGARALAAALISFADAMGESIVAEGIENERTVELLHGLGVRYGQGSHLGEPAIGSA